MLPSPAYLCIFDQHCAMLPTSPNVTFSELDDASEPDLALTALAQGRTTFDEAQGVAALGWCRQRSRDLDVNITQPLVALDFSRGGLAPELNDLIRGPQASHLVCLFLF